MIIVDFGAKTLGAILSFHALYSHDDWSKEWNKRAKFFDISLDASSIGLLDER